MSPVWFRRHYTFVCVYSHYTDMWFLSRNAFNSSKWKVTLYCWGNPYCDLNVHQGLLSWEVLFLIKISEQRNKEHRTRVLSKGLFKTKITLLNVSVWLGAYFFFRMGGDLGKNRVIFEALLHYLYIWSLFLLIYQR